MTNLWTADRRIYLDAQGNAVEAKDPTRVSLLVAVGNTIPLTQAMELGLVATAPEPIEETPATSDEPDETDEHPDVKPQASPKNKAEKPAKNK